jgi:hypothetical protein
LGERLKGSRSTARERRLRLDPEQVARDKRIDEATVDIELALEARAEASESRSHMSSGGDRR